MTAPIDALTAELSSLKQAISEAYDELSSAEEAWDKLADDVAQALADEARERGSKAAPAEHTIVSATRREHRSAYQRWRRAKREVAKLESVAQNVRAELSGEQTKTREQGSAAQGTGAGAERQMRETRERFRAA